MQTGTLLTAAVACGLAFGCSSSGSGGGTKVTGTVTFNGSPVANARVIFTDGGGSAAMPSGPTAFTDESGMYALVGVNPGAYKVVVYKLIPKPGMTIPSDDEGGMDLVQIEASGAGTHALPEKYSKAATTTLTAQVGTGSNTADLKLTGK